MARKPILLTVDDDAQVLRAVERDLRQQYRDRYRVLAADSGATALDTLDQLKLRNDAVALFLVDQRMPQMSGVEFLEKAREIFPDAKRVLLTAYADTDAAIRAINSADVDYYLLKPWDPPEDRLYPVLDDLLDDWLASFRPPFEGVRIVGHRWSAKAYQLRDFLARNQVPYQWLDVEQEEEAQQLLESAGLDTTHLPLVLLPDGSYLANPTNAQVAEKAGLRTRAETKFYDLIIVGGGPAGLAAAVYGASEGLSTVMIEREAPGGQAALSRRIENYLGFPSGLSGADLTRRAVDQSVRFGVEILRALEVTNLRVEGPYRFVTLSDGSELSCHVLLIATGVSYRKLDAPGIERLHGAGVYYGSAMTEAFFCAGEDILIVGGANSAGQAAVYLSTVARHVTMLVRGASLAEGMSQYLVDRIGETENISVEYCTGVVEVHGEDRLESVTVADIKTDEMRTLPAAALFIFIGAIPHTEWAGDALERDSYGFILSGPDLMHDGKRPRGWPMDRDPYLLETSVPGVFVAGDVRHGSVKRIASAVGEGSIAVQLIHQYLAKV